MRDALRRRIGVVIAVVGVLLVLSANRVAAFLTDLWWFDALGLRGVYTSLLVNRIVIGAVFGAALMLLVAGNLMTARRLRPFFVPTSPQQAVVERYRQMADPYLPWLIAGVAALFGLTSAFAVAAQWEPFLLWRNAQEFGVADPQFGVDVGFYVFELPWLKFVQTWLFTSLVLVGLLTAGAHYLLGGIRPEAPREKVLPTVKAHLSVLLAAILLVRAWGYWLDRYMLNFSPRGQVTGASYTDVNAELPALYLLLAISAFAILLTLYNIRRRGFLLPGAAIAILVLASILLQGAYPALIQRLRVDPQELAQERPFIDRNLEMTRAAYDLTDANLRSFPVTNDLDQEEIDANTVTLANVRLWAPDILETTYGELQALRPYYGFADVDVDRYEVDGELRQVMLSTRELRQSQLQPQAQTWQNLTVTYTHGYGIVASQVNTATDEGQPVFLARDIPPRGDEELVPEQRPGLYYAETGNPPYSIVGPETDELDFEDPETLEQITTQYQGAGGVPISNTLRRFAFALRFSDPNVILSDLVSTRSRVLFRRDVQERVSTLAPFLSYDQDPYPVVLGERIFWVQDAYTTSAFYPYSERGTLVTETRETVNYVRNSVKITVDAYDGTVRMFVVDDQDPIAAAWSQQFPDLFEPLAAAPDGLAEHFRYPQDLFELQAQIYTTYHIPNPDAFYSKADEWEIPRDAAALANNEDLSAASAPLDPYYLLMRLPGEQEEEFVLIQPYLPRGKPNMVAWLAGRSDPEHYGELSAVQFPNDQTVLGPSQVQARIEQEDEISQYITLRDQRGSRVIRGNMLVLPLADSILYIEPLFLQNEQARIPELAQVVLVMGDRVVMRPTLAEGLADLVGVAPPDTGENVDQGSQAGGDAPPDDGGQDAGPDGGDQPEEVGEDELLRRALQAFDDAQAALEAGDLGEYQDQVLRGRDLLERLARLRGVPAGETPEADLPSPIPQSEAPADEVAGEAAPSEAGAAGG